MVRRRLGGGLVDGRVARGIPAVVAAGGPVLALPVGTVLAVDGSTGRLVPDPDPGTLTALIERARRQERRRDQALDAREQALDAGVPVRRPASAPRTAGPLVAVCGELAADERAASLLVGLGVRELSVAPRRGHPESYLSLLGVW